VSMKLETVIVTFCFMLLNGGLHVESCKSSPKDTAPPKDFLYFGWNMIVELPSFEPIFNPHNPLYDCKVPYLPRKEYPVTGLIGGKIMSCGGEGGLEKISKSCVKLENGAWIPQPDMKYARSFAAASETKEGGLIVTGGGNENGTIISSTEVFSKVESKWEEGPSLPVRMSAHCQVTSKSGPIVAGMDWDNEDNFLVYNLVGGEWKKLSERKWNRRHGHSCQLLSNERLAVLGGSGGKEGEYLYKNFDILDLSSLTWSEGPHIPLWIHRFDYSAIYKGTLYLIQQENGIVQSIPDNLAGGWTEVRRIGQLGVVSRRRVFPALIVKQNDVC